MKKIGIIGAGFIGQACAQLFMKAGYDVMLSNSRGKQTLYDVACSIGCKVGIQHEAIAFGEVILIAIPFINYTLLPADLLNNKIVFDAMNYYPARDGHIEQLDQYQITTTEMLASHLSHSRIVKVFNAILAKDIVKDAKPSDQQNRRAIPIASDDDKAKQIAISILSHVGFDYVDAGALRDSWRFERAKPAYCIPFNTKGLIQALEKATRTEVLPYNSWHQDVDKQN